MTTTKTDKTLDLSVGSDAIAMPALGFGTWQLTGVTCRNAVRHALDVGYRHVDTARMYENEGDVGHALRESGVPRDELFLTTKVWRDDLSPEGVEKQMDRSLRDLGVDYVDLVLVHWPNDDFPLESTLDALEAERQRRRTRAVGVSNFTPSLVERAARHAPIRCNQVEYHPFLNQEALVELARERSMVLTAYSPLAQGRVLDAEVLRAIGDRLDRTPAQVALRWLVQQGDVAAIPRSETPQHIESNAEIFDFELSEADMEAVAGLASGTRLVDPEWAPAWER